MLLFLKIIWTLIAGVLCYPLSFFSPELCEHFAERWYSIAAECQREALRLRREREASPPDT